MLKHGINYCTNQEYHSDTEYLSSSGLKLILDDLEKFHSKYILKQQQEEKNQSAFNFGTAAHLALLEPHLLNTISVFSGLRKAGKAYEQFVLDNPGQLILSESEKMRLDAMVVAFHNHEKSNILNNCDFEYTMCGELRGTKLKARADAINIEDGYIVDVKTTSYDSSIQTFRETIDSFKYDLSAALYCLIAEQIYGKKFDFHFIVLSKQDMSCGIYKTSSATLSKGVDKVNKALQIYQQCKLTGLWKTDILDTDEEV